MNRKERIRKLLAVTSMLLLSITVFSGCGSSQDVQNTNNGNDGNLSIQGKTEIHYTERDLSGSYDGGKKINLTGSYTIEKEGTYIFSGNVNEGQIIVDTDEQAKVQIVLNGLTLQCNDGPAIYVKSADKVFLTLADSTENVISDGKAYTSSEDEPWGAIFSKDDLTINGSGSLTVNGHYLHGIVSKDSLKITGGNLQVTAVEDGLRGRDEICIHDGSISITAKEDGMKANNDEEEGKGNVSIDGGVITIKETASQGIDGYNVVQVLDGSVSIETENEGIQAEKIYIAGGKVSIDAVDDCLNAKDSEIEDSEAVHEDAILEIAGGQIELSTSAGDGLDSNGHIAVSGGSTVVHGSSGGVEVSMDYNGSAAISGGTVFATGSTGMAQNFDESSTQCSLMYDCSGNKNSVISLKNQNDEEILSYTAKNDFSSLIISTPELEVGKRYTLIVDGSTYDIEIQDTITNYTGGMGGFGGPGGGPGGPNEMHGGYGPM